MNMLINGEFVPSSDHSAIDVINPYDGTLVDQVPAATAFDVNRAVLAAKEAQKSWKKVPVHERAAIVYRFLELVEQQKEELAMTLTLESGKNINETTVEIRNIFTAWRAFAEKAKHLYGTVLPAGQEPGHERNLVLTQREPIGVIACIIPFNFPCNLFNQKVAPALLSGNAAIVKPATDNPITILKLGKLLMEAGIPKGVLQVITGRGATVGDALCSHEDVHAITLTGSTKVGIDVAATAARRLCHVSLELGGNDAFIVRPDADLDLAVNEAANARFYNAGQICCAPKRFLIHRTLKDAFVEKILERVKAIPAGDPKVSSTKIGTLINEKAAMEVERQIQDTVDAGGRILIGGHRKGAFVEPTVIDEVPHDAAIAHDMEVFGPVMPIIPFDTEEEALSIANDSIYGLGGSVFTQDMKKAFYFSNELECGSVVINGSSYFRSFEMPFGGFKQSGIGQEGVFSTFEELTRLKCITLKGIL